MQVAGTKQSKWAHREPKFPRMTIAAALSFLQGKVGKDLMNSGVREIKLIIMKKQGPCTQTLL